VPPTREAALVACRAQYSRGGDSPPRGLRCRERWHKSTTTCTTTTTTRTTPQENHQLLALPCVLLPRRRAAECTTPHLSTRSAGRNREQPLGGEASLVGAGLGRIAACHLGGVFEQADHPTCPSRRGVSTIRIEDRATAAMGCSRAGRRYPAPNPRGGAHRRDACGRPPPGCHGRAAPGRIASTCPWRVGTASSTMRARAPCCRCLPEQPSRAPC